MIRKTIDLTQTIREGMPDWHGCCGFQLHKVTDYSDGVCTQEMKTPNGIGTHMDAPSHFVEGGLDISEIALEKLICPGVVINVVDKVTDEYAISEEDIVDFEKKQGKISAGSIVIGYTGWGSRWNSANLYRNADAQGVMCFPQFSIGAVEYLLKRNISGIAIDTLSPDGSDDTFPVHHKLLSAGKFIIENIQVLPEFPPKGSTIIALPLKIKNATEAPCRVIAVIDE